MDAIPIVPGTILIVPGLDDSGPRHWQTWFERRLPNCRRAVQRDWSRPDLPAWSRCLLEAVQCIEGPVWIVAHSFGCLAAVDCFGRLAAGHRASTALPRIAGALLVAPADPAKFGASCRPPRRALPFPTAVIGSESDPWMSLDRARHWSRCWGAAFVNAGSAGHINVASGHGPWPEGLNLLNRLQIGVFTQAEAALSSSA